MTTLARRYAARKDTLGRLRPRAHRDNPAALMEYLPGADRLPVDWTLTRALATATRAKSDGLLETVGANVPRFDHNQATKVPLGLLADPSRTNLCLQSEDLSTSWTRNTIQGFGSGSTTNSAVAPDGASTADYIADSTTASAHNMSQNITIANATAYCLSVHLKAGPRGYAMLGLGSNFNGGAVVLNLSTGAVSVGTGTQTAFGAINCGDGWWRVWASATSNGTTGAFQIYLSQDGVYANRAYAGDNSSGIYVWGAQCEVGTTPTSYVRTTTASVLRNADAISLKGSAAAALINGLAGTLLVEYSLAGGPAVAGTTRAAMCLDDGTSANYIQVFENGGNPVGAVGAGYSAGVAPLSVVGIPTRAMLAYAVDNCQFAHGGGLATADVPPTVLPTGLNQFSFGSRYGATNSFGILHVRRVGYFKTRLANAVVALLSDQTKTGSRALLTGHYQTTATRTLRRRDWKGRPLGWTRAA
jgi:hypothetical protein